MLETIFEEKKRKSERKYFEQNGEEIQGKPTIFNSQKNLGICLDLSMINQNYHRWRLTDEIDSLLCQDPGFFVTVPLSKFPSDIFLFVLGHGGGPDPTQKPTEK